MLMPLLSRRRKLEYAARESTMVTVLEKPKTYKPKTLSEDELKEYDMIAQKAGVYIPQLLAHRFERFLNDHDIPVFNMGEVVKYMDIKAKEQNNEDGWLWHPLREKDKIENSF